jgi:hypothetical protein
MPESFLKFPILRDTGDRRFVLFLKTNKQSKNNGKKKKINKYKKKRNKPYK